MGIFRPKIAESTVISDAFLHAAAACLERRHRRWRRSRRPEDLYAYLLAVYRLFGRQKEDNSRQAARRFVKVTGGKARRGRHPMRAIIDATSDADRKTKSRWTRALRYAWGERRRCKTLKKCLRSNGGIAGCAQKWADMRAAMRTPNGFVRIGGEGRVPKVPFFVDVRLLDQ